MLAGDSLGKECVRKQRAVVKAVDAITIEMDGIHIAQLQGFVSKLQANNEKRFAHSEAIGACHAIQPVGFASNGRGNETMGIEFSYVHGPSLHRAFANWHTRCFEPDRLPCHLPMKPITKRECSMGAKPSESDAVSKVSREELVDLLNEDLAREYQAIIAYVVYSQVLKGAQYMNVAKELEVHAGEELAHALLIAKQIDYLGGMPKATPKPVKTSDKPEEMLRFDLENENETIRNYRQRVRQCEALGEFAIAETIRQILVQEQDHQIELATALGVEVPNVSRAE
jgi:bacterioferritin